MINLYSVTIKDESNNLSQLHGISKETLLSWEPLKAALVELRELQKYLDGGVLGATFHTMTRKLVQIVRSSYRLEETLDEFMASYKPIGGKSHEGNLGFGVSAEGGDMTHYGMETYGDDLRLVQEYGSRGCVATVIDNDRGGHSLIGGMHYVNRIYYVITQIPVPEQISIDMEAHYEDPLKDDAYERSCNYAIGQVFTRCDLPWGDLMQVLENAEQSGQSGGITYIEDIDGLEDVSVWEQFEDESAGAIKSILDDLQESSFKMLMDFSASRGISHQQ